MKPLRCAYMPGNRRACAMAALTACLYLAPHLPATAQSAPPASKDDPGTFEDIIVTGRRGNPPPQPDAVDFVKKYCFDPGRRSHRLAPPLDEPRWEELEEKTRAQFQVTDPSVPAFSFADEGRGHLLLLKFEGFSHPAEVTENRCTMIVLGGQDHGRLHAQMSELFGASGTERHVGEAFGTPVVAGWRQWAWTAMPGRRSSDWRAYRSRRAQGGSYVVVIDPQFFNEYDYVVGDLKMKLNGARPLSMLSLSHFRRHEGRGSAKSMPGQQRE